MNKRFKPLAIVAAVMIAVAVAPMALATDSLVFDFTLMTLDYTNGVLDVDRNNLLGSTGLMTKERVIGNNQQIVDTAHLFSFDDWLFDLEMTISGGNGNYSATGEWKVTDTDPNSNAIEAKFQSTSITLINGQLEIAGVLSVLGNNTSLLVNRGDPWIWGGTGHNDNIIDLSPPGDDNVWDQLTFANAGSYDTGTLATIKFQTLFNNLDDMFSANHFTLEGGNVKGHIIPAPGALLLGIFGSSLVGVIRRRRRA